MEVKPLLVSSDKEKMHYDFEFSHVDQKFWNAYEDASRDILDLLIKIELE